ncbi:substrate-binding periplasmic protein [Shewanella sp. YIC-542]|uniref:substrate-binding periplasmic protein n=1 Tax=Shewanella mytili TaxID=3377111 RepID=UPI00398E6D7A
MVYDQTTHGFSGQLVTILELACKHAGCRIQWQEMPFQRSLYRLQTGAVHLVPRLYHTTEREAYVHYIGPVALENEPIFFITHKQVPLDTEQQLLSGTLGVKLGSYYSPFINHDPRLKKYPAADDINLAKMFIAGRFDYIAVLDKESIDAAFHQLGFSDYVYGGLTYDHNFPVYYGFSRHSSHGEFVGKLQRAIDRMIVSGEIHSLLPVGMYPPLDE